MMTSGLMTPQGSDLCRSFWARGETRRVDPTVARRQSLAATESRELRPSYPLCPTTIATKDAIQPSFRIASVRGL
jgi:hypothetical protein